MKRALRCKLIDRLGHERAGEVVGLDVSSGELLLSVRFGPAEQVVLPIGRVVELALFGPELYLPHTFLGRPVRSQSPGGAATYSFRIDPARRFELDLVVGGRSSVRIEPKAGEEVSVEVSVPGIEQPFVCPLRDASVTGLSIGVDWADEKALAAVHEVEIYVHVPGAEAAPEMIAGRIRRRSLDGEKVVYGIAFDPQEAPVENRTLRDLCAWVEARYKDLSGGARVLRRTG